MSDIDASEFEPYLTPDETGVPASVLAVLNAETAQGVPTGIARHPTGGLALIQSSGQGAYFLWREGEPEPAPPATL